jgi:hypothetical protein
MDPDLGRGYAIPDKEAALVLLTHLLGGKPYVPAAPRRTRRAKRRRSKPEGAGEPEARELPRELSVGEEVARRLKQGRRPRVGL